MAQGERIQVESIRLPKLSGAERPERLRQLELVGQNNGEKRATQKENSWRSVHCLPLSFQQNTDQCMYMKKKIPENFR